MKTLDSYISDLIKYSKSLNHRAVILLSGESGLKRIGVVCNFIEKLGTKKILYCYVKDNKKRKNELKNKQKSACQIVQNHLQKNCPSEIRWCLYKDTQNILGKTFDICIFQDYKLLTPNVIARGMETVSGGGLIIFLAPENLNTYFNVIQNAGHNEISRSNRFLKRFTVSLQNSKFCICIDDNFNLLYDKKNKFKDTYSKKDNSDLIRLKESLKMSESAFYPLVKICATYDQAGCLKSLCSSIKMFNHPSNKDDNDQRYAVTSIITAGRGRGKSAALGLALCAALQTGITQICVTSPSPENIATLWQYVKLGLKALDYSEHIDFIMTTSCLTDGTKAITKVELKKRHHTQVIRYIEPSDTEAPDCDLLCIDEAAAIPLTILQMYLRSFNGLVFISSTVSGYEGSGMTLSTKLFAELRENFTLVTPVTETNIQLENTKGKLYEIKLEEPIRYGINDPVESFLYRTMCMNYTNCPTDTCGSPATIDQCQLYFVNRDVLFNCKKRSEKVLHQIMRIISASNYKNSPDDLMNLADNGCKRLLCLTDSEINCDNPNIIVVIEISYEGHINTEYVCESLRNTGIRPVVDIISNTLTAEYMEPRFKQLSGIRIDLIATCPGYQNLGYGSRALKLLIDHLSSPTSITCILDANNILMPLSSLPNVSLNYIAVHGTLNERWINFLQRAADFMVVYLESELDEISGECKGTLIKEIGSMTDSLYPFNWLALFTRGFAQRFSILRFGPFRRLSDQMKNFLDNSRYPEIRKDYLLLPNEDIEGFSMQK